MILYQWTIIICQLNLYDTDPMRNNDSLQLNCLYYYVRDETLAHQDLTNVTDEVIPYCIPPTNGINMSLGEFVNTHGQNLSFEELRLANIIAQQVFSWSTPIDLAERYQFYLNERNSLLNERFDNCENMSMIEIVEAAFHRRATYTESSGMMTRLPCYMHLKYDRGTLLCLDWREVCDRPVDCLERGLNEVFYFNIEMNEDRDNEYRCHGELCIPEEFWENGLGNANYLDWSDEIPKVPYLTLCFQDPPFCCEEHSCRTNWMQFACGDGQCCSDVRPDWSATAIKHWAGFDTMNNYLFGESSCPKFFKSSLKSEKELFTKSSLSLWKTELIYL